MGLHFARPVAPGGYAWWYLDALSEDGASALTCIAFVGSVFSPYYAWSRQRAQGRSVAPEQFCALNLALYERTGSIWTMTERGASAVQRSDNRLAIGPSALTWHNDALTIEVCEVSAPWPRRVAGRIRMTPSALGETAYRLDRDGLHHWRPVAPSGPVEVEFDRPRLRWRGTAYCDSNWGTVPLAETFARWHWSRVPLPDGAAVLYDITPRSGPRVELGLRFGFDSKAEALPLPRTASLTRSAWRIERQTRSEGGAHVLQRLEDGPFYARSLVECELDGAPRVAVHETLDLDRFQRAWVRMLLPFRMPRAYFDGSRGGLRRARSSP